MLVTAPLITRRADAPGGGRRGPGVAGAVGVMLALGPHGESAQSAGRADGMNSLAGDQFVGIALVADVPDEFVLGVRPSAGRWSVPPPRLGPKCPPFFKGTVIISWRISSASRVSCSSVVSSRGPDCRPCRGSDSWCLRVCLSAHARCAALRSHWGQRRRAGRVLFELADFDLGSGKLDLTGLEQSDALFIAREEGLERRSSDSIASTTDSRCCRACSKGISPRASPDASGFLAAFDIRRAG